MLLGQFAIQTLLRMDSKDSVLAKEFRNEQLNEKYSEAYVVGQKKNKAKNIMRIASKSFKWLQETFE